uniref:Uncharacterized protein n=1 Tax=Romanomermis culicivorax TaxID=13658 RepID=A0A915IIU4_ROMCU
MTIVIACAYSLLSYNLPYHGGIASSMFTGCLVLMNGVMFLVANVIYLKNFRSAAAKVLCCKSLNSVANANPVVALDAAASNTQATEMKQF